MEDNALYETKQEEKPAFTIDNDNKAEWAIVTIKEEQADRDRLISVCEQKIQEYKDKIEQFKKQYESRTSYLTSQLAQYFQTVPKKKTKTQETYQLPSGKLKLKYQKPEYKRDDDKLVKFLKKINCDSYIKTVSTPEWGEFKKITTLNRDPIIDKESGELIDYTPYYLVVGDGKVVEGIEVIDRPPVFEVEI